MKLKLLFTLLTCVLTTALTTAACSAQDTSISSVLRPVIAEDGNIELETMVSRGYTPLFNGSDLSGWRNPYHHGEAKIVDGEIHLTADKKFFWSRKGGTPTFESVLKSTCLKVKPIRG